MPNKKEVIILAGHAIFKDLANLSIEADENWLLAEFQKGEAVNYCEHIREACKLAQEKEAILIVSGGYTDISMNKSEAGGYLQIIEELALLKSNQVLLEEYALDSYQNLLFSLLLFHQHFACMPLKAHLISWQFKKKRFQFHAETIGLEDFYYHGVGNPQNIAEAQQGESLTLAEFRKCPQGDSGILYEKRQKRNPHNMSAPDSYSQLSIKTLF